MEWIAVFSKTIQNKRKQRKRNLQHIEKQEIDLVLQILMELSLYQIILKYTIFQFWRQ